MVKCADCGFLALRDRKTWALLPADPGYRRNAVPSDNSLHPIPVCFAMARDLQVDIEEFEPGKTLTPAKILRVTQMERECSDFKKWRLGSTPKEHQEMLDRERMMDREDRRDKKMRDWQEEQQGRAITSQWKIAFLAAVVAGLMAGFMSLVSLGLQVTVYKPEPPVVNIDNIIQLPMDVTATPASQ